MQLQIETKLSKIFTFLKDHQHYNHRLQQKYYRGVLLPHISPADKAYALLHSVANTQSHPNLDGLSIFFQKIYNGKEQLNTFKGFLSILNNNNPVICNFDSLYRSLNKKEHYGWGDKTSALFVKSIYHLHNGKYNHALKIWDDAPTKIDNTDKIYIPVDAVIMFIFQELKLGVKINFMSINKFIHTYYPHEIEVWDDLWFWGFISQHGSGQNRKMEFNESKYWALLYTPKEPEAIDKIKMKVKQFIEIFERDH